MIRCDGIIVLQGDTEVVHPPLKIGTDFFIPSCHGDTPTAASKSAQFGFELRDGFPGDSKSLSSEGETEEGSLLGLHYLTLPGIHPDFEPSLKEPADTLHHTLSGAFGLHQYDEVIGIPCELMPPFLQLLIEIVQKDITQEWRKRPSLRRTLGRPLESSVYYHTGPEVFTYQAEDTLVPDSPGDPVHQNVVVNRIEELLKIDFHGPVVSSLSQSQYLLNSMVCRTAQPVCVAGFGEMGIKHRSENLADRLLNHAIQNDRDG